MSASQLPWRPRLVARPGAPAHAACAAAAYNAALDDYEGYAEEDAASGRSAGLEARARVLATLALDRRERLQESNRVALQRDSETPAAGADEVDAEGSPERQRAIAMAALRAAKEGTALRRSAQWSAEVEGAYRQRLAQPRCVSVTGACANSCDSN